MFELHIVHTPPFFELIRCIADYRTRGIDIPLFSDGEGNSIVYFRSRESAATWQLQPMLCSLTSILRAPRTVVSPSLRTCSNDDSICPFTKATACADDKYKGVWLVEGAKSCALDISGFEYEAFGRMCLEHRLVVEHYTRSLDLKTIFVVLGEGTVAPRHGTSSSLGINNFDWVAMHHP
jgi:hypothetical protein